MSDLVERLRTASSLAQALPACREAAARIEALEAAKAEAAQTCNSYLDRALKAEARIEALEAALQAIVNLSTLSICEDIDSSRRVNQIARAALAPEQEK
jgi:hypothetical protein